MLENRLVLIALIACLPFCRAYLGPMPHQIPGEYDFQGGIIGKRGSG